MTPHPSPIEQMREVLEQLAAFPKSPADEMSAQSMRALARKALSNYALQALVDQAQELNMGYGTAQPATQSTNDAYWLAQADAARAEGFVPQADVDNFMAEFSQPASMSSDLNTVHAFLLGEGSLDGFFFGDSGTTHSRSPYWWRDHLRKAIAPSAQPAPVSSTPATADELPPLPEQDHWNFTGGKQYPDQAFTATQMREYLLADRLSRSNAPQPEAAQPAPMLVAREGYKFSEHEEGFIRDIEVMATDNASSFWPRAIAVATLGLIKRLQEAARLPVQSNAADDQQAKRCQICDGTGDVHDMTGEWCGNCPECIPPAPTALTPESKP